ncbi:hypothetical protein CAC42_7496 [Sphaceloma murrayae]|uniref:Galactosyl transferase GMA12/MNN10 family protein n=1 Tax=Sphaceloma murrayae TaxID=2082308 RepID=A0A2K1QX72_9PEZI|nr:hypothetical protein CAC42_7496 [Sphaceloma murrayae]
MRKADRCSGALHLRVILDDRLAGSRTSKVCILNNFSPSTGLKSPTFTDKTQKRMGVHATTRSTFAGGRGPCRILAYFVAFLLSAVLITNLLRAPSTAAATPSSIAKVSILSGRLKGDDLYRRSAALHERHDKRFGYRQYVLKERLIGGFWDRPLYIMSLITQELAKPEDQRLQWLMWYDSDTILMNPNLPLEAFLPPEDQWSHVHMLVTNDDNGLNNGVFFIRVHPWSIQLLKTVLSIQSYEPDIDLEYNEQTALELWLLSDAYREHVMHVPQRWFNAYARGWLLEEEGNRIQATMEDARLPKNTIAKGDLLVHLAGHLSKPYMMSRFLALAEEHKSEWEVEYAKSQLREEIQSWWENDALEEDLTADKYIEKMEKRRKFRKEHGLHTGV